MRFLGNAGISPRTIEFLRGLGHQAEHVRALGMQRASDFMIMERARADGSVILTFDLDFGDILALGALDRPSVIIFRLSDERPDAVNLRLGVILGERLRELASGVLILVEDARYRMRALPIPGVSS